MTYLRGNPAHGRAAFSRRANRRSTLRIFCFAGSCQRPPKARRRCVRERSVEPLLGFTSTNSQLSTQVAVNYDPSLQIQRRSPASERLLLPVEFRYNELAEFDRTGRKVPMVDPSYA